MNYARIFKTVNEVTPITYLPSAKRIKEDALWFKGGGLSQRWVDKESMRRSGGWETTLGNILSCVGKHGRDRLIDELRKSITSGPR